jgi:rod shape-determining protein MreC
VRPRRRRDSLAPGPRGEETALTARTLAWTGFIAIAAFVLLAASRLALLDPVENVTLGVTAPVQNVLHDATQPVADWVNNFTDASALSRENKDLRAENERLTNELARAREEMQQAQNAQDLDAIKRQFPDDQFLQASVIARTSSNVRSVVAIDRGANDGLREGMIVVTEGRSLVGTVTRVFDGYAWVTLITDPKSAVSAMIQESRAEGVVAGNYDGSLNMEFVGQGAAVKDGDFVITSGIGGGYPPGIVIGRVSGVEKTEQDLFQKVRVDHLASLAKLEQVLVITSFEPKALQGP